LIVFVCALATPQQRTAHKPSTAVIGFMFPPNDIDGASVPFFLCMLGGVSVRNCILALCRGSALNVSGLLFILTAELEELHDHVPIINHSGEPKASFSLFSQRFGLVHHRLRVHTISKN
jgi:hypothetical protein